MKKTGLSLLLTLLTCAAFAQPRELEQVIKGLGDLHKPQGSAARSATPDDKTSISGIKEALAIGTENAVKSLSLENGYFGNQAVKILMPPNLQKVADLARKAGFQKQTDEFVLSMNRAAEAAAPLAARHFSDAIKAMTLDDVQGILGGGNTAATDFFRAKTQDNLYQAFKPVVSQKVGEVGAARAYTELMGRYERLPLAGKQSLDLDDYVTRKSLDGLFNMVGQEEQKIRANPAARTTDLLKSVFGKKG
jgi:hypothetical protein